ncbi:GNAT family N-acetyltransferase (plasmid) [Sinorhizobium meliloti]|uniref:GNAT family N-acetyltransferase n=1 Tax=Rhizobium meliloti TaxID=382 RepID=UPI002D772BFD|nr:GNAT family N-acetyltransferase [Sinorhizobium meliloti]WQP17460.1 GNAT family N-acetyltransferase [Sinorhizobium meliloti]
MLIENDLDDRPQYTPWIAALWVEPDMRRRGIAAKLMEAVRKQASAQGHAFCYLCATPDITLLVASSRSKARYPD